jgi:chromosome segregation protein
MRLQRLEIAGFKSFPDRSELAFDQGVTAIVGPNGCGKSNVVDAITWVLGEQSAKSLRGEHMQDIIFAGSDARKATGAAEVRIRLAGVASRVPGNGRFRPEPLTPALSVVAAAVGEQALGGDVAGEAAVAVVEATEPPLIVRDVEVGRRLYRSGESEYLIDGEAVRLKDVQDLLMDAGLGVKAYAVIEQGKIGQILSARPTDRRQLIEEAAGVTKYKSRRRAAELKLEAAQQNLTRVDDIIFEVEKQRGALKRQAAKARRYKRLRDELRRWEKVQFAQRYARLAEAIEQARTRLAEARARETAAASRVAELETTLERVRIEVTEADSRTTAARETAHARELSIGRLQQQEAFDKQQIETLASAAAALEAEMASLAARKEPARLELEARRDALARATTERDGAAARLTEEEDAYDVAHRTIEGLEADVEAARSEVYAAVNAATALRHAMEHAASSRARIGEQLAKLDVERHDLEIEAGRASAERTAGDEALRRAREAMDALHVELATRESELLAARAGRDGTSRELRSHEHQLAGIRARLASLEELEAARAEYGEGARTILALPADEFPQLGSVADHLEVDARYERAVDALAGDLLQHVVVRSSAEAAAGLALVRERNAGRVGFVVADAAAVESTDREAGAPPADGVVPLREIVRLSGPAADAIRTALGSAAIAESRDAAIAYAGTGRVAATLDGDVYYGTHRLEGGLRSEARSILTTKREIKELRERADEEEVRLGRLREEAAGLDVAIAAAESAIASLQQELHRQEKAIVGYELQVSGATEAGERVRRKQEHIAVERRSAVDDLQVQEQREQEARESIQRIERDQQSADEQLSGAQRRLFEARDAAEAQSRRTAEAKAAHAALVERATALSVESQRLEEAARELEERVASRAADLASNERRRGELREAVEAAGRQLAEDLKAFDDLREQVRLADERSQALHTDFDALEATIRDARRALEVVRGEAAALDIERATAESDLAHLASLCQDTVQATLDDVVAEVAALGQSASIEASDAVDGGEDSEEGETAEQAAYAADQGQQPEAARALTADEMVAHLRQKIERMGAVNMMAIDQFDDLESRHTFLTAQRKDLVDSIAATNEAIRRIDKTTRERFHDAFTVINANFEQTFMTLFGGGRAGLVLIDESDALESGIDIIAQPPGKRLQSVQLLSGGEKALTAMALMFAIFKYRPSPFCLLDEIDAPLDDANIGRFVEMLQGMQEHTQFILITHNRKTMEIADRLYGVTMEEPGVSKLISVQLN